MTPQTIFIRSTGTESQHTLQQRLPSVWHNAPLTVHLALAGPDDTSASIPTGANYYLSILATDANKLPTGTALIAATTSLETGSAANSRGPHAIWDLGVGDMSLIEEPGDYWLLLEVGIGGGDRVVRAAGRLTIKASGLQSSPASPTDPNDVFLTTLDMSEGGNGVADDGKVSAFAADGSLTATVSVGVVGGSGRANFKATNVTATRNLEAPDSSGTLATQEWTTTTLGSYALSTALRGKAWVSGYSYTLGDIVSYDEDAYVATSTHTASGANRPDQVSAPWERLVTRTLLTSELAGKADLAGATFTGPVIFNDTISQSGWTGNAIMATDSEGYAVTTGLTDPGGSGTVATIEYADARFRGKAWAEGVSYTDGDVVTYNDVVYTATSTHTSTALNGPGAGLGAPWEGMVSTTNLTTTLSSYALSTALRGKAWAEGVSYTDGDVVTYGDVVYAATSTHTSTALNGPANGLGAPWEPMASYTNLFGGYSSTTPDAGKLVKYGASGEVTGSIVTATTNVVVGQTAGVSGEIQFKDASSSYTVYLQLTDTLTTDVMVQLPVTDGDDVRLATQTWTNTQYTKAPGSTVTDNTLVRFDGTTGKQLQSSQVALSDAGAFTGVTAMTAYDVSGITLNNNSGAAVLAIGPSGAAAATAYGSWTFDAATASTLASFGASKTLSSLPLATYPSLTEVSYVKGVTSAIQTQLDGKLSTTGNGSGVTNLNASNLASGTVPDARLSSNVVLVSGATFTGAILTAAGTAAAPAIAFSADADGSGTGIYRSAANELSISTNGTQRVKVDSAGQLNITATTASVGTTTGALLVGGGVGVGGALNTTGAITGGALVIGGHGFAAVTGGVVKLLGSSGGGDASRLAFQFTPSSSGAAFGISGTTITAQRGDGSAGGTFAASGDLTVGGTATVTGAVTAERYAGSAGMVNAQTGTTYTLQATDNGKVITCTNAGAITVNVPSGLGAGFTCQVIQGGAGIVTFAASGTTVNSFGSLTSTAGQYASASLIATASNVFILAGNLQ